MGLEFEVGGQEYGRRGEPLCWGVRLVRFGGCEKRPYYEGDIYDTAGWDEIGVSWHVWLSDIV